MKQEWRILQSRALWQKSKGSRLNRLRECWIYSNFWPKKTTRKSPCGFRIETRGPAGGLEEVRARLVKIPGQMSDVERDQRQGD